MKSIEAKITSQGQVTIPAEVRRHLGVERGAHVSFVLDGDRVWIEPARSTLESVFGSFVPLHEMSEDFDEEVEDAMADEADRRMQEWFGE